MGMMGKPVIMNSEEGFSIHGYEPQIPSNFYVRGQRYDPNQLTKACKCKDCKNCKCNVVGNCKCGTPGYKCSPNCHLCSKRPTTQCHDWSVNHEPGANKTCGDHLWNYMEPRMILMDNCLNCAEHKPQQTYNGPFGTQSISNAAITTSNASMSGPSGISGPFAGVSGVTSPIVGSYSDNLIKEERLLYDELLAPSLGTGKKIDFCNTTSGKRYNRVSNLLQNLNCKTCK